MTRRWLSWPAA